MATAFTCVTSKCLTAEPSKEHINTMSDMALMEASTNNSRLYSPAPLKVDTYIHVVAMSKSEADGYLSISCNGYITKYCIN